MGARGTTDHSFDDDECSCGEDVVTCQGCGQRICGAMTQWVWKKGNIGQCCLALPNPLDT